MNNKLLLNTRKLKAFFALLLLIALSAFLAFFNYAKETSNSGTTENQASEASLNDINDINDINDKNLSSDKDLSHSRSKKSINRDSNSTSKALSPKPIIGSMKEFKIGGQVTVKGKVLDFYEAASKKTVMTRVTVIDAINMKYNKLRIEETFKINDNSEEEFLSSTAMVADHVIVRVKEGISKDQLKQVANSLGFKIRKKMYSSQTYLIETPAADVDSVPDALSSLSSEKDLIVIDPDYIVYNTTIPDDESFSYLWGMNNNGQAQGTPDADIDAVEAWDLFTGSRSVLVGIIDTGINYKHPDLAANIWTNPGEIPGNNIDDDNNGLVDDVHGYDFLNDDGDPNDDHSHGSHCAGTIGGIGNNGKGVAGVNWKVSMMALKFLSSSGSGASSDAVDCINYATDKGVHLTSNSWGGAGSTGGAMKDALDRAEANNILFIAAAGNKASNNDTSPHYPSNDDHDNVIAVAATNRFDELAYFSNYGAASVDISAPGRSIYSTTLDTEYRIKSGTSMAAPHVAGVCALLKGYKPGLSAKEIKALVLNSGDTVEALVGKTVSGKRLNAFNALKMASDNDPEIVDAASITLAADNSYELYVNGALIGTGSSWNIANSYNFNLIAGKNVIAVKCMDTGGAASMLAEIQAQGKRHGTNASWKVSTTTVADWTGISFNDAGWAAATEHGNYGTAPWYSRVANMPADTPGRWIWSSNNNDHNSVYLRYTIHAIKNTVPVADGQIVSVKGNSRNNTLTLTAADAEGDRLSYTVLTPPANGTLSGTAPNLTYTPIPGFTGDDKFTFKVNDGQIDSNTATVSITVNGAENAQAGLWYGTLSGNIDLSSPNPKTKVLVNVASETENGIAGNTTEVYTGQIFDADGIISFTENIDDITRIWIDGALVLSSNDWRNRVNSGNLKLAPGWHDIEIRISNGVGGSGPISAPGIGFDPNGGTNWKTLVDPGNGSLLRTSKVTKPAEAFVQNDQGLVSFEAENFHDKADVGNKSWTKLTDTSASGGVAMDSAPDDGTGFSAPVRMDYSVNFVKTGTHYIWVRGRAWPRSGTRGNADSVNIGLNGSVISSADKISSFGTSYGWSKNTMDKARATIQVTSTGIQKINVFMREDGFVCDKVIVTNDPNYTPSGFGPAESQTVPLTPNMSSVTQTSGMSHKAGFSNTANSISVGGNGAFSEVEYLELARTIGFISFNEGTYSMTVITVSGTYTFNLTPGEAFDYTIVSESEYNVIYNKSEETLDLIKILFRDDPILEVRFE